MEEIISILLLSIVLEYIVKIVKPMIPIETVFNIPTASLVSLFFGIVISLSNLSNIFDMLGFQMVYPIVGQILTGVLISGGSGFVHELFSKLRASREDMKF